MGHGFKGYGKNASFVSKREIAWHGLGKVVDSMTSKEAIELAGLNFEVGLAPIVALTQSLLSADESKSKSIAIRNSFTRTNKETKQQEHISEYSGGSMVNSKFATFRKDTGEAFNIVGSRYEVIQNSEAFDFFDSIVEEGSAIYETAGALGNGERVFITAKLPSQLIVNKEDIDKYLLLSMSHDGSSSIQVMFTPIRVVCNNTLSAAVQGTKNKVSIRHTKSAKDKLELAKTILGIVDENGKNLEDVFNKWSKEYVSDEVFTNIITECFGMSPDKETGEFSTKTQNKLDLITQYYHEGIGQEGIIGTKWGVYNAVTGYFQNVDTIRSEDTFFKNTFDKTHANIRQQAFDKLLII